MTKKLFAVIIAFFTIIFTSSIIFAEDNNSAGAEWKDSVNKTENTMHNIGNGVQSAISGVVNAGENVVNGVTHHNNENSNNNNASGMTTGTGTNNGTGTGMRGANDGTNYSAVRTNTNARTGNLFGLSNTAWTWIVMIIAAAVIVSLIYYYGSQVENRTSINDREQD